MRFAYWTVMALPFLGGTALAQDQCREAPAVLPHEAWSPHASASADELYRRAREGLEHWSNHPALLASAHEALTRLLAIEPDAERGHESSARLAMMVGSTGSYMLAPEAYDIAHSALRRALELNAESVRPGCC